MLPGNCKASDKPPATGSPLWLNIPQQNLVSLRLIVFTKIRDKVC